MHSLVLLLIIFLIHVIRAASTIYEVLLACLDEVFLFGAGP